MKITIELSDAIVAALMPMVDRQNEYSREMHARLNFHGEYKPGSARTWLPIFAECAIVEMADAEIFKRDVVRQCSWCKRFEGATRWHLLRESDFTEVQRKNFTHGICPDCKKKEDEKIHAQSAVVLNKQADDFYAHADGRGAGRIRPEVTSLRLPAVAVHEDVLCAR